MMKKTNQWIALTVLFVMTAAVLILPFFYYGITYIDIFHGSAIVLLSTSGLLAFYFVQKKVCRNWLKYCFAALTAAILSVLIIGVHSLIRYSVFKDGFSDTNLNNLEWFCLAIEYAGYQKYLCQFAKYAAIILLLCFMIVLIDQLFRTKKPLIAFWRFRMNLFLVEIQIQKMKYDAFVMIDAPSGYGKTYYVNRICDIIGKENIKSLSIEAFKEAFYEFVQKGDSGVCDEFFSKVFNEVPVVIIEDIDLFLSGRETLQEKVAQILLMAIDRDITIVVTGINISENAPYFYWKMKCMNEYSERMIIGR